jgi:cytochrome o ubiquinol oxidase operon protein cyoD
MQDDLSLSEVKKEWHSTTKSYISGFFLCLLLTCTSFLLVATRWIDGEFLIISIVALALLQAVVQLLLFMKAGKESKPRWKTLTLSFMILVLLIIVTGSLWIMYDLNQRVMTEMHTKEFHHD